MRARHLLPALLAASLASRAFAAGELPPAPPDWKVEVVAQIPALIHPSVVTCAPDGRIFVAQDPIDMSAPSDSAGDSILCIHPDGRITKFADNLHAVFGLCYIDGKLFVHHTPLFSVFTDKDGVGVDRQDLFKTNPNPNNNGRGFNDHIPSNIRLGMDGWLYMSTGDKGIFGAVGRDGSKGDLQGGGILRFRPDATQLEPYANGTRNHLDVAINAEDEMFTYDNTDDGNGWWTRVTHMVDGGFYGYPFDYRPRRPYTLWMMADYGGGSGTGAIAYNEDALPAEYRGNLFLADWSRKQILRLKVSRDGATYKIDERVQTAAKDFLTQGGTEFRPVGLAISPDGMSLYVADWNHSGWKANKVAGRLLKITYTGPSQAAPKPAWWIPAATAQPFSATDAELIAGLHHPAQSVRMVAQRRLAERGAAVVPALKRLLAENAAPAHARWHAVWTLDAIDGGASAQAEILAVAASATDTSVRSQAIRQLGTRRTAAAATTLAPALRDSDPIVRFRAATALGRMGQGETVPALTRALDDPDFFARYAVFTALRRIGLSHPDAWPRIAQGFSDESAAVREGTFFAMRETFSPESADALARVVALEQSSPEARKAALNTLAELHRVAAPWSGRWWGTQPVIREKPAPRNETWAKTALVYDAIQAALQDRNESVRRTAVVAVATAKHTGAGPKLREMWKQETAPEVRQAILRSLGAIKDPEASAIASEAMADPVLATDAIAVAGQIGDATSVAALTRAANSMVDARTLVGVLEGLGHAKMPETAPTVARFLAHPDAAVRTAASIAVGNIGGDAGRDIVMTDLDAEDADTRRAAAEAAGLLKDRTTIPKLLLLAKDRATETEAVNALAAMPDLRALDLYLDALTRLNGVRPYSKPTSGINPPPPPRPSLRFTTALEALRDSALPLIEERHRREPLTGPALAALQRIYDRNEKARTGPLFAGAQKPADAAEYMKFALGEPGDAALGRTLFSSAGCVACHRVGETGAQIGPDLSDIAVKYDRTFLIEAVLQPSKQILNGYQAVNVTRKNGSPLMGFLRSETAEEIILVDIAGEKHTVPRAEVTRSEEIATSLMPEGLHASLSLTEFANLIAYLASLKGNASP